MVGMFFEYFDGFLRVTFRNGPWAGDIEIMFHVSGDTVATTPCDDDFVKGEPQIAVAEDVVLRCWTSGSVSRFFQHMVSWLEAVTCNVMECAFFWDGEGPEGELRWIGGPSDSGLLSLTWSGRRDSQAFEHKVRLEKSQMVRNLYQSFREFVESDRYDPISYETLLFGEVFDLVVNEGRETLVRELAARDRSEAYALIQTILGLAYELDKEYPRRADLAEFIRMANIYWKDRSIDSDETDEQIGDLLDKAWNEWTADRRSRFVEDKLFMSGGCSGFGENLRQLRSTLIESWLSSHA
jgi:hypothetical protein